MENEILSIKQNFVDSKILRNAKNGSIKDNILSIKAFFSVELFEQKY